MHFTLLKLIIQVAFEAKTYIIREKYIVVLFLLKSLVGLKNEFTKSIVIYFFLHFFCSASLFSFSEARFVSVRFASQRVRSG